MWLKTCFQPHLDHHRLPPTVALKSTITITIAIITNEDHSHSNPPLLHLVSVMFHILLKLPLLQHQVVALRHDQHHQHSINSLITIIASIDVVSSVNYSSL